MKKLVIALTLITSGLSAQNQPQGVHVTGEGVINVVPDQVLIDVRVEHEGDAAVEVKNKTDQDVDKVFKFLKKEGIAEKYVQTERISLNKNYQYNTKTYRYVASQSISIKLVDISKYENVIAGLLNAGINRIGNVNFTSSKLDELTKQARVKAIKDAKEKAKVFADALGQDLGKAIYISESNNHYPGPMYKTMAMESSARGGNDKQTIAVGEMQIKVDVQVNFALH